MTDEWYAIEATVDPSAVEAIEDLFNGIGALGTEVQQFYKKENEPLTVIGYFDELPDANLFDEKFSDALRIYDLSDSAIKSLQRKTIEKTDWLAEWKKHWRPTRVGRFLIVPEWQDPPDVDYALIIRIDPNMAFGTGTHETTKLCLTAIGERLQRDDSFLDIGTGTGILAIAAAKVLGRTTGKLVAVDNDPLAVEIARENAGRNGVGDQIEFRCEEISANTPQVDFVCANLTLDIIQPMLPLLIEKSQRLLVLSGVLKEQQNALSDELECLGISNIETETAGEWISATIEF